MADLQTSTSPSLTAKSRNPKKFWPQMERVGRQNVRTSIDLTFCGSPSYYLVPFVDHVWTWQFAKLMHTVMTTAFSAKPTTYVKIIELDKRIRDFPDPACIQPPTGTLPSSTSDNVTRTMQALFVTLMKDTSKPLKMCNLPLGLMQKYCSTPESAPAIPISGVEGPP